MGIRLGGALALGLSFAVMVGPALAADAHAGFVECPPVNAPIYGPVLTLSPKVTERFVMINAPCADPVAGEIIYSQTPGSHPAVLFVHWLGDPKTTNHTEFEADAIALAERGVTSLLIDAIWSKPGWFDKVGVSAKADVAQANGQLAGLYSALDVLEDEEGVDPDRIAYVGHDFGAMFGALLASDDTRLRYVVLMAGVPTFSEWYLLGKAHPNREAYVRALDDDLDIPASLARSKARAFLFQFAAHDRYISAERAAGFSGSSPLPRAVMTYDTDHALAVPQATADRRAWLIEHLFAP